MTLQLGLLIGYSIGLVALGLWIGRRVEGTGDFFVAGRRLGPLLIFATVLAANIGAGSTVGAAGLGYRDGLSAWWWVGSAGIGTLLLAFWIGPRIWRVARDNNLYTVGDYLELRYGASVRAIIAALLWFGTLAILAGQFIAMAQILGTVAGAPRWLGVLIGGVVMTIYFTAGGLLTSAWINLVQLSVLLVGFAVALPWALAGAGGWEGLVAAAPADVEGYLSFFHGGQSGWIYVPLLVPAFIVSPGLIQKIYGAVDERAIKIGVGATGVALLLFAFAPALLGMAARVYDPALASHEMALPAVLILALPPLLGTLALAAVFSAEISSADALLFMLATSLSKDLYKRFLRPEAGDRQVLFVARVAAVSGGALAMFLALALPTVIEALTIFYALLGVSLFVPVVAGLYSRRPGVPEALAAIGAGVVGLLVARLLPTTAFPAFVTPSTVGLTASAVAFGLVFVLGGRRAA